MRLLAIPALTKLAAASPFHCCLVSPGSKRVLRTHPLNLVDNRSFSQTEILVRDGRHSTMCSCSSQLSSSDYPFPGSQSGQFKALLLMIQRRKNTDFDARMTKSIPQWLKPPLILLALHRG